MVNSSYLRPRQALRAIRQRCLDMEGQEQRNAEFHTLIAVDLDVVTMAAFPAQNLQLGSVFHAWGPLNDLANRIQAATDKNESKDRVEAIEGVFSRDETRIPLLTTIALGSYIFDHCTKLGISGGFVLLPPLEQEWANCKHRARKHAAAWYRDLKKQIDLESIRRIINAANGDESAAAKNLVRELPQNMLTLFPARLAPDYAQSCLFSWELAKIVRRYSAVEAPLPRWDKLVEKVNKDPEGLSFWRQAFEKDLDELPRSPSQPLKEYEAMLARLKASSNLSRDAVVLAVLDSIHRNPPKVTLPVNGEPVELPLRVILLTATARTYRVARARDSLAADCLRNPIAYLSDGRFYEWAFGQGESLEENPDSKRLLRELRSGQFAQWLSNLTEGTDASNSQIDVQADLETFVDQWEKLMSHLSTRLSLELPSTGLRQALAKAGQFADLPTVVTNLLQSKVIEVTHRVAQQANKIGLQLVQEASNKLRNLPPVDLRGKPEAHSLVERIGREQVQETGARDGVLKAVFDLASSESGADGAAPLAYVRTILLALLWFRLQHWEYARDAAGQAAVYALAGNLEGQESPGAATGLRASSALGDEALYLAALTGRLCATSQEELFTAKLALDKACELQAGSNTNRFSQLRNRAEGLSLETSKLLLWLSGSAPKNDLARLTLDKVLAELEMVEVDPRAHTIGNEDSYDLYLFTYAVQQLYCSLAVLAGMQVSLPLDLQRQVEARHDGFNKFSKQAAGDARAAQNFVADSHVSKVMRLFLQIVVGRWKKEIALENQRILEVRKELDDAVSNDKLPPMDQLRHKWIKGELLRFATSH